MSEPRRQYISSRERWDRILSAASEIVPVGSVGRYRIEHRTVTEDDEKWGQVRAMVGGHGRYVPAGTYSALVVKNRLNSCFETLWMSNTPDEIMDSMFFLTKATGKVFVSGLGLGCVVRGLMANENVESVEIVELSPEVVALVGESLVERYGGDRIKIHVGDVFEFPLRKGQQWDCAWHDIWATICEDNLESIYRLERKFRSRVEWQLSWKKEEIQCDRRAERRRGRW